MNEKNYPSSWISYDSYISAFGFDGYEFPCEIGDVNRFGARFRVAVSFKEIVLEGYGSETADGYSALCKVFLAWSAFEAFMKVFDIDQKSAETVINSYSATTVVSKIRTLDENDSFYKFIYERVNKTHQKQLDEYFTSNPCNALYLASAIRHLFAHGPLTPNASKVRPSIVCEICQLLYEFLIHVMDSDFTKHIERMNRILVMQR